MNDTHRVPQTDKEAILNKILMKPSKKIQAARFSAGSQAKAANCSGRCASGSCR